MELNEYQDKAMSTCMPSCDNFSYMMLNLVGEVGELASRVAKLIRKDEVVIGEINNHLVPKMPFDRWMEQNDLLMKEAGDILWQLSGVCKAMGWTLEEVAQENLNKLASRQRRGVIDGDGDLR